jgi:hypothetical protein
MENIDEAELAIVKVMNQELKRDQCLSSTLDDISHRISFSFISGWGYRCRQGRE